MVVIFGSEQLTSGKVRESNKTKDKARQWWTQEGHTASILQSGQAESFSIADMKRLRSETRDGITGRRD